jgi:hypothetical protein
VKGFGSAVCSTTKRLIAACKSTTDTKTPRFNRGFVSLAKKLLVEQNLDFVRDIPQRFAIVDTGRIVAEGEYRRTHVGNCAAPFRSVQDWGGAYRSRRNSIALVARLEMSAPPFRHWHQSCLS